MGIVERIAEKVIAGDINAVEELTRQALAQKIGIEEIMNGGYVSGLDVVGEKFSSGEIFLPEMLVAGMAVKAGIEVLRPLMIKAATKPKGTVVAGTVIGDIHDIGKNIVCMMLEGSGFRVIDLGTDVAADAFIKAAGEHQADIIAMSALLSTTRANMKQIIDEIRASEAKKVSVMVGGAPLTQEYAASIGADGYALNAAIAVKKARELMGIH